METPEVRAEVTCWRCGLVLRICSRSQIAIDKELLARQREEDQHEAMVCAEYARRLSEIDEMYRVWNKVKSKVRRYRHSSLHGTLGAEWAAQHGYEELRQLDAQKYHIRATHPKGYAPVLYTVCPACGTRAYIGAERALLGPQVPYSILDGDGGVTCNSVAVDQQG